MARKPRQSKSVVSADIVQSQLDHVEPLKTGFKLKDDKHQSAVGPTYHGDKRPYSVWDESVPRENRLVLRSYWRARVGWGIGEKVKVRDVITKCGEEWGDGTLSFKDQKKILKIIDALEQDGWIFKLVDRASKPIVSRSDTADEPPSKSVEELVTHIEPEPPKTPVEVNEKPAKSRVTPKKAPGLRSSRGLSYGTPYAWKPLSGSEGEYVAMK